MVMFAVKMTRSADGKNRLFSFFLGRLDREFFHLLFGLPGEAGATRHPVEDGNAMGLLGRLLRMQLRNLGILTVAGKM